MSSDNYTAPSSNEFTLAFKQWIDMLDMFSQNVVRTMAKQTRLGEYNKYEFADWLQHGPIMDLFLDSFDVFDAPGLAQVDWLDLAEIYLSECDILTKKNEIAIMMEPGEHKETTPVDMFLDGM